MKPVTLKPATLAWLLCLSVCLIGCSRETAVTAPATTTAPPPAGSKPGAGQVPGGTVDTRKDLDRLASAMPCLPAPTGTRYYHNNFNSAPPTSASDLYCRNGKHVLPILPPLKGFYGLDSISYFDSLGAANCPAPTPTVAEYHVRYLLDTACGEAWERIRVEMASDPFQTRQRSRGTGRLRLLSGLAAEIEAYELDMALDHTTGLPTYRSAHLRIAAPGGYSLRLDLVNALPFRELDFFADWQIFLREDPVMAGPVLRGADTVGQVFLYGDRTLEFLDSAGRLMTPG